MAESEKELKSLLMKVKEKRGKVGLKLNIQKTASGPIGDSERLHFLGSRITADDDCSREIKKCLLLGSKAVTTLDSILKSRGTRDQIANICWIIEKKREFQKNIYFCFIDYTKAFSSVDHNKLGKFLKRWKYQTT